MRIDRSCALASAIAAALACSPAAPVFAQEWERPLSLLDSVPIGSNGLCEAQIQTPRPGDGLFDRRYVIVCQDAAAPVGQLAVLGDMPDAANMTPDAQLDCAPPVGVTVNTSTLGTGTLAGLSNLTRISCTSADGLERLSYSGRSEDMTYKASGVAIYDDALQLGLASLAAGKLVEGTVEIPLTQASDASAFARAQAEAVSPEAALAEAYRRSNAGSFADAAEFFDASAFVMEGNNAVEARLNAALQQSNLGNYLEAAYQFEQVSGTIGEDPVLTRLTRNFAAVDALNRDQAGEAIAVLDTPLPGAAANADALRQLQITQPLAARLTAEQGNAITNATGELTVLERTRLLDAQAIYLRAAAMRVQGRGADVANLLEQAQTALREVREGRIASVLWLRAQILAEQAEAREDSGDLTGAEALLASGVELLEANYAGSPALVSARAQLAAFLVRNGRDEEALALFGSLIEDAESKPTVALRRLLAPYFDLLATRSDAPETPALMFAAAQMLQRPGLAQTQAVLARELSGGSDEAAQLFRQSINIGRAIERLRADITQRDLDLAVAPDDAMLAQQMTAEAQLAALQNRQLTLHQQLAAYPRYRVATDNRLSLADLQATLLAGEAYYKLAMLGDAAYAIYVEPDRAQAFAIKADARQISGMVDSLRDSIAIEQSGQTITYPFELATARALYSALFGPVTAQLGDVTHLVFEPDGALLQLPVNLLVVDDASVARYAARTANDQGDPYDFTGTVWLGRDMQVSTAVSPASFRDVRATRNSDAAIAYLGLGQNQPLGTNALPGTGVRAAGTMDARCQWGASAWNNPIQDDELRRAEAMLQTNGDSATLLTGAAFSDTRLKGMEQLDEYRILHFATHGLVTSPQPQCPPRPALLTSFGDANSDGLLTFAEIFDLELDADLVILSACNTASVGGLVATREAGVSGGGDFALDGLVRAFVGAGGRTVVASHWPVPDDYDATNRLISGFFASAPGVATTESLRQAQLSLMDDADTSHPFYWSAFAVVGDGTIPVRR